MFWNLNHVSCNGSTSILLKFSMLYLSFTIFDGGKNLLRNASTNSSQEVIESYGSSANHLTASPKKENGNNLNRIASWVTLFKLNGEYTSMMLRMCSCVPSYTKPPNNHFNWSSWSMVHVTWNTTLSASGGNLIASVLPTWSQTTLLRFPTSSHYILLLVLVLSPNKKIKQHKRKENSRKVQTTND